MKNFGKFTIALLLSMSAVGSAEAAAQDSLSVNTAALADKLIEVSMSYKGTPYKLGRKGPKYFDCSGFTSYVYKQLGIEIPENSARQAKAGREVTGPFTDLQKGDIIIFGSRNNKKKIGHVGIFIEMDESGEGFRFIHSAVRGGVQVNNIKESYYSCRFLGARRILPDFIADAADTVACGKFPEDGCVTVVPDTLHLKEGDSRVLLLGDGTWAFVSEDGRIVPPTGGSKLVLHPDGRWTSLTESTHRIPVLSISTATPHSSSTSSDDSGAVYHKVKSGDTLSGIAARNHTTVNAICRLNGITPKTILKIGRNLRIK